MHSVNLRGTNSVYPVGKIICLGRNYLDHIRELNNEIPEAPVIFCKPASSLLENGGQIKIPTYSNDCHHELELALLIGKTGKQIPVADAQAYVCGYGVALDLTLRDVQTRQKTKGLPWEIAKGFDTSCPLSDFVPAAKVKDPDNLALTLRVNGEIRQQGNTNMMMRSIARIISEMSDFFTLEPGDIILTGTPAGVAQILSGDQLEGEIEQVGRLTVTVA
jgi:5-carboxymethyl-2-hydroxymuconate isomerase